MGSRSAVVVLSLTVFSSVISLSFHLLESLLNALDIQSRQEVDPPASAGFWYVVAAIGWLPFACLVAALLAAATFHALWPIAPVKAQEIRTR